ncbi:uncharacterized protein LOC101895445 [Musca domestica]|uniref:Uncharacterized protein LOC101895445 n=1 Tax=Musca domestica TaxID=7370 RepID=A0A9J7D1T0_MUSDO|nr:uncharacterized protein LOC101895445 [Musca domestica]
MVNMMCLLCLKTLEDKNRCIEINSSPWLEFEIEMLIDKHLWSMGPLLTTASCICSNCWDKLYDFHKFYKHIEGTHELLIKTEQCYDSDDSLPKTLDDNGNTNDQHSESSIEIKQEPSELLVALTRTNSIDSYNMENDFENEEDFLGFSDESNNPFDGGRMIIKTEPYCMHMYDYEIVGEQDSTDSIIRPQENQEPMEVLANNESTPSTEDEDDSLEYSYSSDKSKDNDSIHTDSDDDSPPLVLKTPKECQANPAKNVNKQFKLNKDEDRITVNKVISPTNKRQKMDEGEDAKRSKTRARSNEEWDELLHKYFNIKCHKCDTIFANFDLLRTHFSQKHNELCYIMCCSTKFFKRSELIDHVNIHLDAEYFKCNVCSEIFDDRQKLNVHKKIHGKTFVWSCDICHEKFPSKRSRKVHEQMHVQEQFHGCHDCGKMDGNYKKKQKETEINKRKMIRYNTDVMNLPDKEFEKYFRLTKKAFTYVLEAISPEFKIAYRSSGVSNKLKLAATLLFLGQGSYQLGVGSDFNLGLSQPTVSKVLAETLSALEKTICPIWIKLQMSEKEKMKAKEHFFENHGFPGVIGCVGGTYIKIKAPAKEVRHMYNNRKGVASLNAMVICDHNMHIRFLDARHGGATPHHLIWSSSKANTFFKELYDTEHRNYWLLGGSEYPLEPYLMIPFARAEDGSAEAIYNTKHSKARHIMERTIGVLKNRFRCLFGIRPLYYEPNKAQQIVNVCAALHNICIQYGSNPLNDEDMVSLEKNDENLEQTILDSSINEEASAIREKIKLSFL